jgi:hypothetical protein
MKFKHEKDMLLFTSLHPVLIMIYADLHWYARSRHFVDLTITDTISTLAEDKKLNRTSSSHREARAIDIRTKDLDTFLVADLVNYINSKKEYKRFHYLSNNGQKRLAYLHGEDENEHIHLAIHSQFGIKSE